MTSTEAKIEQARETLAAGKRRQAAHLLGDAVYQTWDSNLAAEIRALAEQGRRQPGLYNRRLRWTDVISEARLRAQHPEMRPPDFHFSDIFHNGHNGA